jgi:hypothetical protein
MTLEQLHLCTSAAHDALLWLRLALYMQILGSMERLQFFRQGILSVRMQVGEGFVCSTQVIYPMSIADAVALEEGTDLIEKAAALDKHLDELMGVVRLQYLVSREGGWGAVREWGEVLSLGELGRIMTLSDFDLLCVLAHVLAHSS